MKSTTILAISFSMVLSALAQHGIDPRWATPTAVAKFNALASATGAVANNMVVTNNGTVILFYKENNANYDAGSSDNGKTWNAPAPTLFTPATKTGGNSTISADLDLAGNIHTIWSARTPSGLFYSRWGALVQSWSDTLRLSQAVRYRVTFSQITTDRKNRLHAMWMDGDTKSNLYSEVMYSRSTDGGRAWSAPVRLSKDDNMHSAFPMSDFSGATSDTLGIAWRDSVGSNNWDIVMAYTSTAAQHGRSLCSSTAAAARNPIRVSSLTRMAFSIWRITSIRKAAGRKPPMSNMVIPPITV